MAALRKTCNKHLKEKSLDKQTEQPERGNKTTNLWPISNHENKNKYAKITIVIMIIMVIVSWSLSL